MSTFSAKQFLAQFFRCKLVLTHATNRYEQLTHKANALREELHTETMRMLNDVIKFKMHVQKNLEEYEEFVAGQLEEELGDEMMRDDATQTQGFDL